jgi:hypothetical protein
VSCPKHYHRFLAPCHEMLDAGIDVCPSHLCLLPRISGLAVVSCSSSSSTSDPSRSACGKH